MSTESHGAGHAHPGPKTYALIAAVLCTITLIEFGVFYTEALQGVLVPLLIVLSAIKFALVVMFYMHLKFDHPIFTRILVSGMITAFVAMLWVLALYTFSHPL